MGSGIPTFLEAPRLSHHKSNIKAAIMWFWSQSVVSKPAASSPLKLPGLEYLASSLGVKERTLVRILVPSISLFVLLLSSVIFVVINSRNSATAGLPAATALLDKDQLEELEKQRMREEARLAEG